MARAMSTCACVGPITSTASVAPNGLAGIRGDGSNGRKAITEHALMLDAAARLQRRDRRSAAPVEPDLKSKLGEINRRRAAAVSGSDNRDAPDIRRRPSIHPSALRDADAGAGYLRKSLVKTFDTSIGLSMIPMSTRAFCISSHFSFVE